MANLTITVDEATLKRARIRAIERGESVNRFLAEQLAKYAEADDEEARWQEDRARMLAVAEKYSGRRSGAPWSREDLYEERFERYRERS
jgi:post-segregation antitoxin (ccd killing protein)